MAWRDREGWLNFVILRDGRVEDEKERDERRWETIMKNWDFREFRVQVNLTFLRWQVQVPIQRVCTLIRGLLNPIRPVVPLISHSRSYPPYPSHIHPLSLFLTHNSTIMTSTQSWVIPVNLSMPWTRVNNEYCIHRAQHTPSIAYPEYSIHPRLFVFRSFSWLQVDPWMWPQLPACLLHDRPPSASSPWGLKGEVTMSHSHVCELTNWWMASRRAIHRPPPWTRTITLDHGLQVYPQTYSIRGLQVHLQTRSSTAPNCISRLARLHPPSASLNSLNYGLEVHISKPDWSRPPSAFPNSLDHNLGVHLQVHSIMASMYI